MELSEKLFMARTAKRLTKQDAADLLDMDVTTYGRVEAGQRNLDIDKLKLLPKAFGIEAQEILELLEFDKYNTFNINGDFASGSANGYVQNLFSENNKTIEKLLQSKDEQISMLKSLLEKK